MNCNRRIIAFRYGLKVLKKLIQAPLILPIILLVRSIRPILCIRFGYFVNVDRLGHLAFDVALYLAEKETQKYQKSIDLFWLPNQTCNDQWAKMIKRSLIVKSWVKPLEKWNRLIPMGELNSIHPATITTRCRDIYGSLAKSNSQLEFNCDENNFAKQWLKGFGWKKNEKFICLMVRDSSYLTKDSLHDWDELEAYYHNYRDSDILEYKQAAEWLADQGYWVIRMGKTMQKPFK